jgi:Na+-transporting NADH:ubiquinone oxidoreductase subunit A
VKIKLSKGLNIPITGSPSQFVDAGHAVNQVALLGADYVGLKPRMLVSAGQAVGLGEPLFLDKHDPEVRYTSPGTGRVVAVNRGRRRVVTSVVIELDDSAANESIFELPRSENSAEIRMLLLQSGLWTSFRTRPYNRVAQSSTTPRSIFVTAIDTRPLAADPGIVIAERADDFETGMSVISRLTEGPVYLCTGANWLGPDCKLDGIRHVEFEGPHPAGLSGTHIHHLDPVGADRMVWHIGYQDVIAIGHLCRTGRLLSERIVSVAGPGVLKPRLIRTRAGANVEALLAGEVEADQDFRFISGSVLDGFAARGARGFLGRYHNQISVVPDKAERRLFGWVVPGPRQRSCASLLASLTREVRPQEFTTARNGRQAAMIPVEAFERVMPMDILPVPLLRALLVKDTDAAQALGCLELAEEDVALFSFICPAKKDYGTALRINLEQIEKEG